MGAKTDERAGVRADGGGDTWERYVARQEEMAEVEAELREAAAELGDAALLRLARRRLDDRVPGWEAFTLEFRDARGRVVRRVRVHPAADGPAG